MAQDREPFLRRWSRRKLDEADARAKPAQPAEAPPPELPPIDSLTPESDFSAFMHKQVDDKLRRAALRKLFSDPAFNVVDGLDDYAEDYTQLETLAEGAAATLEHAKRTLLGRDPDAPAPTESPETATADADPAQDTPAPAANEKRDDAGAADTLPGDVPPPADALEQKKA
ncbi:MAG: DUF3306 domain-containing protein [bacterium]|jgi:hypothetical protein